MSVDDLIQVLHDFAAVTDDDEEQLLAHANEHQEGTDASEPGMISKEEWDSIWEKIELEGLRDKVWPIRLQIRSAHSP